MKLSRWCALLAALALAAPALRAQAPADSDSIAGIRFRNIGPSVAGGRVSSVVGVPGQPNLYYVGAAAGGVWKTENGGNSWTPVFEKQPSASIGAVALAPSNPNLVWVGTGEANIRNDITNGHGVWFSPDAGRSWKFMGLEGVGQISRIVVDPQDPDHVLVAAVGQAWTPNPQRGVFLTTDGGRTWKRTLFVNDTTGAADLVMQPGNPRVLFAAMWQVRRFPWELVDGGPGSGLYRSTDGGASWEKLKGGLPSDTLGRIAVAVAPSNPNHVYALIEARKGLLWESRDLGDHWTEVSENHALDVRPFYFSLINVAPDDENHLYFSSFQLMESSDGGRTAHSLDADVHPDHHALWIDPQDPSRMIQGNDGGVYVSGDRGRSWRFLNNLPIGQFYMVAADGSTPYRLCGGLQDNNAWCGPSNTLTGGGMNGSEWRAIAGGDGEYAVPAPSDSNVIYVDSQNGFIARLDRKLELGRFIRPYLSGVEERSPAELRYRFNWTAPIAVSPRDANEVYLAANVLFRSADGGAHWTPISGDLTRNDKSKQRTSGGPIQHDISGAETYNTILSVTLAPTDPNTIWVGTDDGYVQRTVDGGRTWSNVTPGGTHGREGRFYQVGVSPADANAAYVAFDRHMFSDNHPYVFRTSNGGKSWTEIDRGLPPDAPAHVVREDPNQRGFLVLGTDRGLYSSRDYGAHWQPAPNFPTAPVWDLHFVARTNDLIVATHGRGIFVLDDLTPLQGMTEQVKASPLYLFPTRTATLFHSPETEAPSASMYTVPNPPRGATVDYYLRAAPKPSAEKREEGGKPGKAARILITDARGDTVLADSATARQGVNRYVWNLRYAGPTKLEITDQAQGQGAEETGEGNRGPNVLPGTYHVVVTAGGNTQRGAVTVTPDPRLPFDVAAAQAQLRAGLQLRDDMSALNTMMNRIHSLRGQLAATQRLFGANAPGAADSVVVKQAKTLDDHLKALADSIYNADVQRGVIEDDIHYLTLFYDQMDQLTSAVTYPYDEAPNAIMQQEIGAMRQELERYLARFNALLQTEVGAYNRVAAQHNAPIVVAGPPVRIRT